MKYLLLAIFLIGCEQPNAVNKIPTTIKKAIPYCISQNGVTHVFTNGTSLPSVKRNEHIECIGE
jgi:hypothetical protein